MRTVQDKIIILVFKAYWSLFTFRNIQKSLFQINVGQMYEEKAQGMNLSVDKTPP